MSSLAGGAILVSGRGDASTNAGIYSSLELPVVAGAPRPLTKLFPTERDGKPS